MAKQFVVRPLVRTGKETAEGMGGPGTDVGFAGRQIVVYANTKVDALAQGEQRLGMSAAKLEAIEIAGDSIV